MELWLIGFLFAVGLLDDDKATWWTYITEGEAPK